MEKNIKDTIMEKFKTERGFDILKKYVGKNETDKGSESG